MRIAAEAKLKHRNEQLQALLIKGNSVQIIAARELLRLSLVEMHELGYWREYPDQFKIHMQLYRASATTTLTQQESMFAPDKKVRYSL